MNKFDQEAINCIRVVSAEAIEKAKSGHPGLPLGAAAFTYNLWAYHMKHSPNNPDWPDRDRFVLSAGHGSMLLYSLLYLFGYELTLDDIKNFRQLGSKTPGHPEYGHTKGVEITTGPLGQGFANAVGMAIAETMLAKRFNVCGFNIVDHYTYVLCGDGCMMEGITSEAASLAGHLKLGKLIVYYDFNKITIDGSTDITFTEDVKKRFEAYDWQVLEVDDGNDMEKLNNANLLAKNEKEKPTLIIVKTTIGYGCPAKQGKSCSHGEPLGVDNLNQLKETLGYYPDKEFFVSKELQKYIEDTKAKLCKEYEEWLKMLEEYKTKLPEMYEQWNMWNSSECNYELLNDNEIWKVEKKSDATRNASGKILNRVSKFLPNLVGGSADLASSNKTYIAEGGDYSQNNRTGVNIRYGIREHAMAAITNGIAAHGGLKAFCSTFFVFSDYMRSAVRMSAIMKLPVIYIFTHDSIGVGEDGPTHQPIEHLASLRCMPNLIVFRPADSKETAVGWSIALSQKKRPTALILSRQNLPYYEETGKEALKGGYIVLDSQKEIPEVILIATGSELELGYKAYEVLKDRGIDARVVSMPCWEIFDEQDEKYKEKVLPKQCKKRIAIEAGSTFGWQKYVGCEGKVIGIDNFGASGKNTDLFNYFGFTLDNVIKNIEEMLAEK